MKAKELIKILQQGCGDAEVFICLNSNENDLCNKILRTIWAQHLERHFYHCAFMQKETPS